MNLWARRKPSKAGMDGMSGRCSRLTIERSLFDLEKDPAETRNVIGDYPEVAERLKQFAESHQKQFYSSGTR